jgi:hypothetical protein
MLHRLLLPHSPTLHRHHRRRLHRLPSSLVRSSLHTRSMPASGLSDLLRISASVVVLQMAHDFLTDLDAVCLAQCSTESTRVLDAYRTKASISLEDALATQRHFDVINSDRQIDIGTFANVHVNLPKAELDESDSSEYDSLLALLLSTPARTAILSGQGCPFPILSESDASSLFVRSVRDLTWKPWSASYLRKISDLKSIPDLSAYVSLTDLHLPAEMVIDRVQPIALPPNLRLLECGQFFSSHVTPDESLPKVPLYAVIPVLPSSLRVLKLPNIQLVDGLPPLPNELMTIDVVYRISEEVDVDLRWISTLPMCLLTELRIPQSTIHLGQLVSFDGITRWPAGLRSIDIKGNIVLEMNKWTPPPSLTHLRVPPLSNAREICWPRTCKQMDLRRLLEPEKFRLSELVIPEGVEEVHISTPVFQDHLLIEGLRLASTVRSLTFHGRCVFPALLRDAIFLRENSSLTSLDLGWS